MDVQASAFGPELPGTPFEHAIDPATLREVLARPAELAEWLDGQLSTTPPEEPDARRRFHTQLGTAARLLGRHDVALEHLRIALDLAQAHGSPGERLLARVRLGQALHWSGDFPNAHAIFAEALPSPDASSLERSFVHQHAGKCYFDEGRLDEARRHFAEALELRKQGNADRGLIQSAELALSRTRYQ